MYLRSSLDQEKLLNMAVSTENETNEEFYLKKKINKKKIKIKKLKKQKQKLSMEGALGIDESNPGTIQNIKE